MRLTVGMRAPSFETQTLDGRRISRDSFRGRNVLLKFYRFATCREIVEATTRLGHAA